MNRSNVWTLAALGDVARLQKALAAAPTAVNVAGWSYAEGTRAGLVKTDHGTWVLAAGPTAAPVRLLHLGAVTGNDAVVREVLQRGADANALVAGVAADEVAAARGDCPNIVTLIQAYQKRQTNKSGAIEEDEAAARDVICCAEAAEQDRLVALYRDGVVNVQITFRKGGTAPTTHVLRAPRYASCKSLQCAIEALLGERVLVSFTAPVSELQAISQSEVLRLAGTPALRALDGDGVVASDDELDASKSRTLALRPRTVPLLLHLTTPQCVARPLASHTPIPLQYGYQEATSHSSQSFVSRRLEEMQSEGLSPSQRVAEVRKIAKELETTQLESAHASRSGSSMKANTSLPLLKQVLSPEDADSLVERLYQRSVSSIRSKHAEQQAYLEEGNKLLWRRRAVTPGSELPENISTSVSRLYDEGLASKQRAIDAADAAANERAVRPKSVARTPEEIAEASQRLYNSGAGKESSIAKLSATIYGDSSNVKVLEKAELDSLIQSVYTTAVEKKAAAKAKAMAKTTDFKALTTKRLSKEQLEAVAKRLSSKS